MKLKIKVILIMSMEKICQKSLFIITPAQEKALWQYGVDTGQVWQLQGWYGRTAQSMLDDGYLHYPEKRHHDYYGNPIPTKKEMER